MNEKTGSESFTRENIMFTLGGTEALTVLTKYIKEEGKDLLVVGPGYFKAYDQE